jgi:hypothetical protein
MFMMASEMATPVMTDGDGAVDGKREEVPSTDASDQT